MKYLQKITILAWYYHETKVNKKHQGKMFTISPIFLNISMPGLHFLEITSLLLILLNEALLQLSFS